MAFWDVLKRETKQISATVPISNDMTPTEDPPDNYFNFSTEGYGKNAVVYTCIRELATACASVRYMIQVPTTEGGFVEDLTGEYARLLIRPNDLQDWYTFIERFVTYLEVSGNAYILKERDGVGRVRDIYLLRPDRVSISPRADGKPDYVYEINGREYKLPFEDVGHLRLPNPADDNFGLSPLHVVAKLVNLDMSVTDFNKAFFRNAGVPSGLLRLKKRITSQEEANVIRNRWHSSFGGRNLHQVAVLDEDAEYQPMATAPKDMAMSEIRDTTESRICSVFGVPPMLVGVNVGLQRSTYSNSREARFAFFSQTIVPLVTRIVRFFNFTFEQEFINQGQLAVDMGEYRVTLDDDDNLSERSSLLFERGVISLNESREMVGLEALPYGDIRRLPSSAIEYDVNQTPPQMNPVVQSAQLQGFKVAMKAEDPVAKRSRALSDRLIGQREVLTDKWESEFKTYFNSLKQRVDGIMGRMMERSDSVEVLKAMPAPGALLPEESAAKLGDVIYRMYIDGTRTTFEAVNDSGLAGTVHWSDQNPIVTGLLSNVPERTKMIHHTTSKAIAKAVEIALERGYTIEQLARGVPTDKFPGVQSVFNEASNVRARLIARTEIMRYKNLTSTRIYQGQGFEYARADDPDGAPNDNYVDPADPYGYTCAERHGTVYPLIDAQNIMDHPNGRLTWLPMPKDYQPQGVST